MGCSRWTTSFLLAVSACAGVDPMDGAMPLTTSATSHGDGGSSADGAEASAGDSGGGDTGGSDSGGGDAGDEQTSGSETSGSGADSGSDETSGGDPTAGDGGTTTGAATGGDTGDCGQTNCANRSIASVTALGHDGNVPGNAVDGDLNTRWSLEGSGAWIQLELGTVRSLCNVKIAWFRGDERSSDFAIEASTDGSTWSQVFSGTSSGTLTGLESYTVDAANAKLVRVVVSGNSDNQWASISEIQISGADALPQDCDPGGPAGDSGGDDGPGDSGGNTCAAGPTEDKNGVEFIEIPGFTYDGAIERFDWRENFKSNGSMRHDFEGTPESNQCLVRYILVDGPDDEEISAKLGGGPHTDSKSTWADVHDLAITNFAGDRSRIRWEATHPSYDGGPTNGINIGDIRDQWVGAMGCKLNLDEDGDGEPDHVWYLAWVDVDGLDGSGNPQNNWIKTFDEVMHVDDIELKSPTIPYVVTIGEADEAQATIRVDEQDSSYDYDHIAYRSPVACP